MIQIKYFKKILFSLKSIFSTEQIQNVILLYLTLILILFLRDRERNFQTKKVVCVLFYIEYLVIQMITNFLKDSMLHTFTQFLNNLNVNVEAF